MPSIKGTASISSSSARTKLLRSTKFPSSFSKSVNLSKVNIPVLTQWIEKKIESILSFEDEIVSSMAVNLFLPQTKTEDGRIIIRSADPRRAQLDLVGFLGEVEASKFAKELWSMLLDAQSRDSGIPKILVERKKAEMMMARNQAYSESNENSTALTSNRHGQYAVPSVNDAAALGEGESGSMSSFLVEATRRAAEARKTLAGTNDSNPQNESSANVPPRPVIRQEEVLQRPKPIPVSPTHPSSQHDVENLPIHTNSPRSHYVRERNSSSLQDEDRNDRGGSKCYKEETMPSKHRSQSSSIRHSSNDHHRSNEGSDDEHRYSGRSRRHGRRRSNSRSCSRSRTMSPKNSRKRSDRHKTISHRSSDRDRRYRSKRKSYRSDRPSSKHQRDSYGRTHSHERKKRRNDSSRSSFIADDRVGKSRLSRSRSPSTSRSYRRSRSRSRSQSHGRSRSHSPNHSRRRSRSRTRSRSRSCSRSCSRSYSRSPTHSPSPSPSPSPSRSHNRSRSRKRSHSRSNSRSHSRIRDHGRNHHNKRRHRNISHDSTNGHLHDSEGRRGKNNDDRSSSRSRTRSRTRSRSRSRSRQRSQSRSKTRSRSRSR